jgi:hypothetical protein
MRRPVPVIWSLWIDLLSVLLLIYGLAMVATPELMNTTLVGPLLFNNESFRGAFAALVGTDLLFVNVVNGLLGAVTVGYAILIAWVAFVPFRRGERWAWIAIATSITAWAILEAYVKFAGGLGIAAQAHLGFLVVFWIPLLATARVFFASTDVAPQAASGTK